LHAGLSWIDVPVMDGDGEPIHQSGILAGE